MDEEALHILLMLGFHRSNREIARRIKREGLMPGQPKILEYLWFHDGASQKDISRECIIDKSTVTSLLKRMENLDLIRKETRPEDQRGVAIFLTDKGWEKAKRIRSFTASTRKCGRTSSRKHASSSWRHFSASWKMKRNGAIEYAAHASFENPYQCL